MADKGYIKFRDFGGVNKGISERDDMVFLEDCTNFDSNVERGKLVTRKGQVAKVDLAAANLAQIFEYRDEDWEKMCCLPTIRIQPLQTEKFIYIPELPGQPAIICSNLLILLEILHNLVMNYLLWLIGVA